MTDLQQASREELFEIIARQQAQISQLLARVAALEKQVAELQEENHQLREENRRLRGGGGSVAPSWVKPNRPQPEKKPRKPRAQAFVRRREAPTEVRYHALECCPDCGRQLSGGWEHRRRQTIEVILQRQVIDHVVIARRCGVCGKRWLPQLSPQEVGAQGKRRFGANLQSLIAALHISGRVPLQMIRRLLKEMFELQISAGEIVALLAGVKKAGEKELTRLKAQVRGSPAVCADETGWRQDGENGYLWGFFTPTLRYFLYQKSRAGAVPVEVLGEEFDGVTVSDFYGGYNKLAGLHQRCWAHLLRDLKELAEENADRLEVVAWTEAAKALYREGKACRAPEKKTGEKEQRRLERALLALAQPYAKATNAPQRVLAERMVKHAPELFLFVADPEVPSDNNLAERSLRPAVIARKISGGTRSEKGSKTKMGLMSLFGTWAAQERPLLPSCRNLLLTGSSA